MVLFKKRGDCPQGATPTAIDPSRAELAQAISEKQQAARMLGDAKAAVSRAEEAQFAALDKLNALRRQNADPEPVDAVSAILSGDVLSLEKPEAKALEITQGEHEVERWRAARIKAEEAVEARTRALADAERVVDQCAKAVLTASLNIDELLKDAEEAAAWLVATRASFLYLMSILPDGPQHQALADFMRRPWLASEIDESWKRNPALKPFVEALERLRIDAQAKIDNICAP